MKTTTLTSMMTCAWKAMRKHSPEILTALGIAGFTTAAVMAVKVTPKALEKVRQDSQKNHNGDRYAYTKKRPSHQLGAIMYRQLALVSRLQSA